MTTNTSSLCEMTFTRMMDFYKQLGSSPNFVVSQIWKGILSSKHVKENWQSFSLILAKKQATMILGMKLKNGVKVCTILLNGHALHHNGVIVITKQVQESGLLRLILHRMMSIITEEDLSSCHGTTITEPSPKFLLKVHTIVSCTCSKTQTKYRLMLSQCSLLLFGFI